MVLMSHVAYKSHGRLLLCSSHIHNPPPPAKYSTLFSLKQRHSLKLSTFLAHKPIRQRVFGIRYIISNNYILNGCDPWHNIQMAFIFQMSKNVHVTRVHVIKFTCVRKVWPSLSRFSWNLNFQWKMWCSVVPYFTQIGKQTWRIRVGVHWYPLSSFLRPTLTPRLFLKNSNAECHENRRKV
jgi:hypothetical protein